MQLHLYGPRGIAQYVDAMLRVSDTYLLMPVVIHEFTVQPPDIAGWEPDQVRSRLTTCSRRPHDQSRKRCHGLQCCCWMQTLPRRAVTASPADACVCSTPSRANLHAARALGASQQMVAWHDNPPLRICKQLEEKLHPVDAAEAAGPRSGADRQLLLSITHHAAQTVFSSLIPLGAAGAVGAGAGADQPTGAAVCVHAAARPAERGWLLRRLPDHHAECANRHDPNVIAI